MVDELNTVKRAIPYEEYFGEMDLDEEEIEKRIELAKRLEPHFLMVFTLVAIEAREDLVRMLADNYRNSVQDVMQDTIEPNSYMDLYIQGTCSQIVDTTILNEADEYYTSLDRAMLCSENETNSVANYYREIEAIKNGSTKKTWITMRDKKVRHSHVKVHGKVVGVFDSFKVGESRMLFPMDASLGARPEEIIGCRCVVKYS